MKTIFFLPLMAALTTWTGIESRNALYSDCAGTSQEAVTPAVYRAYRPLREAALPSGCDGRSLAIELAPVPLGEAAYPVFTADELALADTKASPPPQAAAPTPAKTPAPAAAAKPAVAAPQSVLGHYERVKICDHDTCRIETRFVPDALRSDGACPCGCGQVGCHCGRASSANSSYTVVASHERERGLAPALAQAAHNGRERREERRCERQERRAHRRGR